MKSIGDRMKRYELASKQYLTRRTPIIVRVDGKSFHTFTRGMERPFDKPLMNAMAGTAGKMVSHMDGAVFAYQQSDEISILLKDWTTLNTEAWFDNNVQKIASVSASLATGYFNLLFDSDKMAFFDARVFSIPMEEVANYFIWRQQDATRNSIQMVAQAHFSQKQLHCVNTKAMQEKLITEKDVNWNDCSPHEKRGAAIVDGYFDMDVPIFTQEREYIERLLEADTLDK